MAFKMFVYGSLMEGFYNYDKYLKGRITSSTRAYVIGSLYRLDNKSYPAFINDGESRVYGQILSYEDESIEREIDLLEEYLLGDEENNMYNKERLKVYVDGSDEEHMLNVYIYNTRSYKNKGTNMILLDSGDWEEYMR